MRTGAATTTTTGKRQPAGTNPRENFAKSARFILLNLLLLVLADSAWKLSANQPTTVKILVCRGVEILLFYSLARCGS